MPRTQEERRSVGRDEGHAEAMSSFQDTVSTHSAKAWQLSGCCFQLHSVLKLAAFVATVGP